MPHRVRIHRTGGPEVLDYEAYDVGAPGPGQVRLVQQAAGVNFVDTQFRDGIYPADLPLTLGVEGVGVVDAVGAGVDDVGPGDRVGYWLSFGGYADVRLIDAERLVAIPDPVASELASAIMTKGLSAWAMVKRAHRVRPGETVLVHGASGGVGLLAAAWAQGLGATVVATADGAAKVAAVRAAGLADVLDLAEPDLVAKVRRLAPGGVDAVYDLVGAATFARSVAAVRDGGDLVHFGNASGPPEIDRAALARRAIAYSKPDTGDFITDRAVLLAASADLWGALDAGLLPLPAITRYPLREARRAHEDIKARRVAGSLVLVP